MVTYAVNSQSVALVFDDNERVHIREEINRCLEKRGFPLWGDIEAELFTLPGRSMLIARPRAPRQLRFFKETPRLRRL